MNIRTANQNEAASILDIYEKAKLFMRKTGNLTQWADGYPSIDVINDDIKNNQLYVIVDENNQPQGVFAFIKGPDVTYEKIYDGSWPEEDYFVIHRIAVAVQGKGIASEIFDYCTDKSEVIRVDTHKDNIPMQKALLKYGFSYCGIIHLLNGDERLAYRKERK